MALGLLGVDTWSDFLGGWGDDNFHNIKGVFRKFPALSLDCILYKQSGKPAYEYASYGLGQYTLSHQLLLLP